MSSDCIFCAVAVGRIPADVVAESSKVLAFRDINPAAPTHVLIIPKRHIVDSVADLTSDHAEILGEMFELAADVARVEDLDEGWRLVSNVGPAAGQTVHHLHFHLLGGWSTDTGAPRLPDERGG